MKICVTGLWHLGSVTAACLVKKGFTVFAWDPDTAVLEDFAKAKAPLFEPGLDDLLAEGIKSGRLRVCRSAAEAVHQADFIWIAFDTPVDHHDQADTEWVTRQVVALIDHKKLGAGIIVASQVPTGTCAGLEAMIAQKCHGEYVPICYTPENLRLGKALEIFQNPDRIVIGIRRLEDKAFFEPLFKLISPRLEWMKTESAEMTKHAINSFLAASVVFANELATLCQSVGADAREVERGLKTESRIGPKAYLKPGAAFAGGTLARDVQFLISLGKQSGQPVLLFNAILQSNLHHKSWAQKRLEEQFKTIKGLRIGILGLTYKEGTDTLRRSWTVELGQWLHREGAEVFAYDWQLQQLPNDLSSVMTLKKDCPPALEGCDALVIGTDHPGLKTIRPEDLKLLKNPSIIDPNGSLNASLIDSLNPLDYWSVGFAINRSKP